MFALLLHPQKKPMPTKSSTLKGAGQNISKNSTVNSLLDSKPTTPLILNDTATLTQTQLLQTALLNDEKEDGKQI